MSGRSFNITVTSPRSSYSLGFKRMVVQEFERGGISKDDLMRKYGIGGHSVFQENFFISRFLHVTRKD